MRILVTGASGFVGRGVVAALSARGGIDIATVCRRDRATNGPVHRHVIEEIDAQTDWSRAIAGREVVVHLAGLAHVRGRAAEASADYFRVNHRATEHLAAQSAYAGIRRFIFVSSIAVHGRSTTDGDRITSLTPIRPTTRYAESKARAEDAVRDIGLRTGMEVVVIRPPMVYGPHSPGNYGRLVRLVRSRVPLPFANVDNRRSLVGRGNLADLLVRCATHPCAAGRTLLASDDDDVSTPRLLRCVARAMGLPLLLFSAPRQLVEQAVRLVAGARAAEQLMGSLQLDISETKACLEWRPLHTVEQGISASMHEASD